MKNVPEANATATQALMNARGVDTFESPSRSHPKWLKYWIATPTRPLKCLCLASHRQAALELLVELFMAEFERGARVVQQSTTRGQCRERHNCQGHVLCQSWRRGFMAVLGVTILEEVRQSGPTEPLRNPVRSPLGKVGVTGSELVEVG